MVSPRRTRLSNGVVRVAAVSLVLAVTGSGVAHAEVIESGPEEIDSVSDSQAAALESALARDLGISLDEYAERAQAAIASLDLIDQLEETVTINGAELDGTELVVYVPDAAGATTVERAGVTAVIGEPVQPDLSDEEFLSANDVQGGLPYGFPLGGGSSGIGVCSVGFAGVNPQTGERQFLTAGHCAGDLQAERSILNVASPGRQDAGIGALVGGTVPGSHVEGGHGVRGGWDHGLVRVTRDGWASRPQVVTWGFGAGAPLASDPIALRDVAPAVVGAPICKSGGTTGWTCGVVTGVDVTVPVVRVPGGPVSYYLNAVVASICIRAGDSGGPGLVGSVAVGVVSASNSGSRCDASSLGAFAPMVSRSGLPSAQSLYGSTWEPLVSVAQPVVTSPSGSGVQSPTVMTGTLPHGGPRHRVEVTINGSIVRQASVGTDGVWRVSLDGVGTGVNSYSVRARWGERSASSPRTGEWWSVGTGRRAGEDRFATAVEISREAFPERASVVIVANGLSFADALSAGPAAVTLGGPVLLVGPTSIPTVVRSEIQRLRPDRIIIVGGTGVVSAGVANELRSLARGGGVVRLGGSDRYETSRLVAQFAFPRAQSVYLATGANFPDALSAGAAAASRTSPVVLVPGRSSAVDRATRATISSMRLSRIYIAGGAAVVSSALASSIRDVAPVTRLSGDDRFGTSLAINRDAFRSPTRVAYVANGLTFPDALAGSALAGARQSPLYIAQRSCIDRGVVAHLRELRVGRVTLLGGGAVISSAVGRLETCR